MMNSRMPSTIHMPAALTNSAHDSLHHSTPRPDATVRPEPALSVVVLVVSFMTVPPRGPDAAAGIVRFVELAASDPSCEDQPSHLEAKGSRNGQDQHLPVVRRPG